MARASENQTYTLSLLDDGGNLSAQLQDSKGKDISADNPLSVEVAAAKSPLKVKVVNADAISNAVASSVQSDSSGAAQSALSDEQFAQVQSQIQGLGTMQLLMLVGIFLCFGVMLVRYFFDGVDDR